MNIGVSVVFVQLIHNTDSDSLTLLLIKDYLSFEITEIEFGESNCSDIKLLIHRLGDSIQNCLLNVTTMFMSFELENIVRKYFYGLLKAEKELSDRL